MVALDNCNLCELQRKTVHVVDFRKHEAQTHADCDVLRCYDDNLQHERGADSDV